MHALTARTRYDFGTESGSLFFLSKKRLHAIPGSSPRTRTGCRCFSNPHKESVTVHLLFLATQTDIMYFQLTKAKWTNEVESKFSLPRS